MKRNWKMRIPRLFEAHFRKKLDRNIKQKTFFSSVFHPSFAKRLRLDKATMELLTGLPGTRTPKALATRATALSAWRERLARGVLPEVGALTMTATSTTTGATTTATTTTTGAKKGSHPWPDPELASALVSALRDLEMPRFCSKHPALLDPLLKQLVGLVGDYEKALAEAGLLDDEGNRIREQEEEEEEEGEEGFDEDFGKEEQRTSEDSINSSSSSSSGRGGGSGGGGEGDGEEGDEEDCDPDAHADDDGDNENEGGSSSRGQRSKNATSRSSSSSNDTLEASLEQAISDDELAEMLRRRQQQQQQESKKSASSDEVASRIAKELADKLAEDGRDAARSLRAAEAALDPETVDSLIAEDGGRGFDASAGLWQDVGWREVAALSRVLSECRELRDLVRSLGRSAGRGPRRRAPAQVAAPPRRGSPGVLRSPLQPEETAGLARSGDISRMLPSEAHLVAVGWPRGRGVATRSVEVSASIDTDDDDDYENDGGGESSKNNSRSRNTNQIATATVSVLVEGSRPARLLHMARRAERTLMSYERDGWLDDPSTRATRRFEVRPAAEDGPLILCLDTSGSMAGARETVAKAVALEAARSARRSRRRCLLYAFGGPGDLRQLELELGRSSGASDLLAFLRCSFGGGTDADAPLEAALTRLEEAEWAAADVLVVTDGELPPPSADVGARLERAKAELGLQVHGLLVGGRAGAGAGGEGGNAKEPISEGVAAICSRVHVFKSWSAVGGR